jgi:hypothetical protein
MRASGPTPSGSGSRTAVLLGKTLDEEEADERLGLLAQAVVLFEAEAAEPDRAKKADPRKAKGPGQG